MAATCSMSFNTQCLAMRGETIYGVSKANPNITLPLAKIAVPEVSAATPIGRQRAALDVAVNAGKRPFRCASCQPVLHGVVMYVIHMPRVVGLVPNEMLPIPPLPDSPLALRSPAGTTLFSRSDAP